MKDIILLSFLVIFVLLVNSAIISLDLLYPEQPLMYVANQTIHSLRDFLQIYLHPKMFHVAIMFFRPSGHFLLYQLLTPLLGWHNTQGLVVVNLLFLALTGFVIIKLYNLLFPGFKVGGYIAFAIYLMHPALILSRLIILHFEFAYVLLVVGSLYCFVRFCGHKVVSIGMKGGANFLLLLLSLFLYVLAVTFKEPAIMLGPVLVSYFWLFSPRELSSRQFWQIILLIMAVTLSLVIYLSMQWPMLTHPLRNTINFIAIIKAAQVFLVTLFAIRGGGFVYAWCNAICSNLSCFIMVALGIVVLISSATLLRFNAMAPQIKKSFLFLFIACIIFSILPVAWAWGLPWHLSLTLLFLGMIMGFSCEFAFQHIFNNKKLVYILGGVLAFVIGLNTIAVNYDNIVNILKRQSFAQTVGRNAVFHPPQIHTQLNVDSVIVVEDSVIHDSYLLGASIYSYSSIILKKPNLDRHEETTEKVSSILFIKQQSVYNGSLFKWAYLMPALQEEVYPFQVEHMDKVPDAVLYSWLRHYDNIFCLGYDSLGNWHDRTAVFKKNLAIERSRRHLLVKRYGELPAKLINGRVIAMSEPGFPDYQLCQLDCDQSKQCKGFTYISVGAGVHATSKCVFYDEVYNSVRLCAECVGFVKRG